MLLYCSKCKIILYLRSMGSVCLAVIKYIQSTFMFVVVFAVADAHRICNDNSLYIQSAILLSSENSIQPEICVYRHFFKHYL